LSVIVGSCAPECEVSVDDDPCGSRSYPDRQTGLVKVGSCVERSGNDSRAGANIQDMSGIGSEEHRAGIDGEQPTGNDLNEGGTNDHALLLFLSVTEFHGAAEGN